MSYIRDYVKENLILPMKENSTNIQDTIIELIIQKLETLYAYTLKFPEIVSPDKNRLDILKIIADQFLFTIRDDADIDEQIEILDNILSVYNKRGSIDSIENMWKYYGGNLPKEVEVIIPSYNVFRYSMSRLSGTHTFINGGISSITLDTFSPIDIGSASLTNLEDNTVRPISGSLKDSNIVLLPNVSGLSIGDRVSIGDVYEGRIVDIAENSNINVNRSGVYEIRLTNNQYPIPELREFLIKELVAAGNYIYFTNSVSSSITEQEGNESKYKYDVNENTIVYQELEAMQSYQGLTLSGIQRLSTKKNHPTWSGKANIFIDISNLLDIDQILYSYLVDRRGFNIELSPNINIIDHSQFSCNRELFSYYEGYVYSTPKEKSLDIENYFYNDEDKKFKREKYFVLGGTKLGEQFRYIEVLE